MRKEFWYSCIFEPTKEIPAWCVLMYCISCIGERHAWGNGGFADIFCKTIQNNFHPEVCGYKLFCWFQKFWPAGWTLGWSVLRVHSMFDYFLLIFIVSVLIFCFLFLVCSAFVHCQGFTFGRLYCVLFLWIKNLSIKVSNFAKNRTFWLKMMKSRFLRLMLAS